MGQRHLIAKQTLDLEITTPGQAYGVQQQVSELVWSKLAPAMETLFDRLVAPDEMIQLDTITIDIPEINLEKLNVEEFVKTILEQLEETIVDKIQRTKQIPKSQDQLKKKSLYDLEKSFNKSQKADYKGSANNVEKDFRTRYDEYVKNMQQKKSRTPEKYYALRRHHFETWLYWLDKGTLPPQRISPKEDWIQDVLDSLGLDLDAVSLLRTKLKRSPIAIERLIRQHTPFQLQAIIELYTGFSQKEIYQFIQEIEVLYLKLGQEVFEVSSFRKLEILIWNMILREVILKGEKLEAIALIIIVFQQLVESGKVAAASLHKKVLKTNKGVPANLKSRIPLFLDIYTKNEQFQSILKDHSSSVQEKESKSKKLEKEEENQKRDESYIYDPEGALAYKEDDTVASPQFINNAGVIMLHPFLKIFFQKLDLLKGKDFKDEAARSKAVLLLYYLACGQEIPAEYDLVLPKFLCQMPFNAPMDYTQTISKEEKEEAEGLLAVTIQHWGVLGTTSPDGLRGGFLTRKGKFEHEQTGWKLYVESETMDILLDKLPWGISLIKLPWMEEVLKVEWR